MARLVRLRVAVRTLISAGLVASGVISGASAGEMLPTPPDSAPIAPETCLVPRRAEAPERVALRELFLVPGRKITLSDIPPATLAMLAEDGRADAERAKNDWAHLCRFAADNRQLLN